MHYIYFKNEFIQWLQFRYENIKKVGIFKTKLKILENITQDKKN